MAEEMPADLAEAVRRFGDAWARGDVSLLDALLSPTHTHGAASGKLQDRSAWLAYAALLPRDVREIDREQFLHICSFGRNGCKDQ